IFAERRLAIPEVRIDDGRHRDRANGIELRPIGGRPVFQLVFQPAAILPMALARSTSRSVTPPASWLVSRKSTRFHTLVNSGWWSAFSAWRATRARKPNASLKSLN